MKLSEYQEKQIKIQRKKISKLNLELEVKTVTLKIATQHLTEDLSREFFDKLNGLLSEIEDLKIQFRTCTEYIEKVKTFSLEDTRKNALKLANQNLVMLHEVIKMLGDSTFEGHEEFLRCFVPNLIQQKSALGRILQ